MSRAIQNKPYLWKTDLFEAPLVVLVNAEPANPEYLHILSWLTHPFWTELDLDVKCTEDLGISEWMFIVY